MQTHFTPGPYKIHLNVNEKRLVVYIKHELSDPLLVIENPTGRDLYNAMLFRAAPTLYAALKTLIDNVKTHCPIGTDPVMSDLLIAVAAGEQALADALT